MWFLSFTERSIFTLKSDLISKKFNLGRNTMLALTLTLSTLISIIFLLVGGMLGWIAKQHFYELSYVSNPNLHPEMYDDEGNILPDQILAVRFENDYDYDDEEEDD